MLSKFSLDELSFMYKLKSTQQPYFLGLESIRHGTEPLGLILRAL